MTLLDIVRNLEEIDSEQTIYARHPWSQACEAKLAVEGSDQEKKLKAEGLIYFLEGFIAQEFIEDWGTTLKQPPSPDQACARLIDYATNDA
jgi:hypothetical protein